MPSWVETLLWIKLFGGLIMGLMEYGLVVGKIDPDDARKSRRALRIEAFWRAVFVFVFWPLVWP